MEIDYTHKHGAGVPVFFFPTFPLDRTYLENSMSQIEVSNPLVFFDYRNHGRSPDVEDEKDLTFAKIADDVEELRKNLGYEKITIFGHGLGGLLAFTYLTRHMKHVGKVVIFSSSASAWYRGELAWNIRQRFSPQTKNELDNYFSRMDPNSLKVKFSRAYTVYFEPPNLGMAQKLLDGSHRVAYDAYYKLYGEIEKYDVRSKLRKFKNVVLIVTAEHDVWPLSYIRDIQNHVRYHKLMHFEGMGHFAMVESPQEFWKPIFDWINQQD